MNRITLRLIQGAMVAMMAAMIVLVFGNVVLRYVFNSGIAFSEEASRFIFMWLTLTGALLVMHDKAHLGMSTVVSRLGETGQRACRLLADAGAGADVAIQVQLDRASAVLALGRSRSPRGASGRAASTPGYPT